MSLKRTPVDVRDLSYKQINRIFSNDKSAHAKARKIITRDLQRAARLQNVQKRRP